ncbi:MAG: glycosyltransferase family 2 protein [Bacteroidales bacterium]|nr:glycosyltransferase family 2 protein [Bacteroidales bacterium]
MFRHIYIAIPACDEEYYLPKVLEALNQQTTKDFEVWICVNQPDSWNENPTKKNVCESNARLLSFLHRNKSYYEFKLHVLDCTTPGKGWDTDKWGASIARKYLMDTISSLAKDEDIIVSLDADTIVEPIYVEAIRNAFDRFTHVAGITFPYFHLLEDNEDVQRSTIRYETYLRNYFIELLSIGSPYAYVPIGSAFAVKVKSYKAVRGMPLKTSGEDFYFLQKVRQVGFILPYAETTVYPSGRISNRVLFGTGKALSYSFDELCLRYPLFRQQGFNQIKDIYQEFNTIANSHIISTEMLTSLFLNLTDVRKILSNYRTPQQIHHALHIQFNALKIFKLLKKHSCVQYNEDIATSEMLARWGLEEFSHVLWKGPIEKLKEFQKRLFHLEMKLVRSKLHDLKNKKKSWWKYLACW